MTSAQLRRELEKRKLGSRGLKAELIRRLKEALRKDGSRKAVVLQTVDHSALFVHVDSEGEDEAKDDEKNQDELNAGEEDVDDQQEPECEDNRSVEEAHKSEEEEEDGPAQEEVKEDDQEVPEISAVEKTGQDELDDGEAEELPEVREEETNEEEVQEDVQDEEDQEVAGEPDAEEEDEEKEEEPESVEEFKVEDCYAFASGFKGKVAKKALLKAFGEFGTIIGVKQVAKKCRIQYDHPLAVERLINADPPFSFNNKTLNISRTLESTADKGRRKSSKRNKKWAQNKGTKSVNGDVEEVETGRGDEEDEEAAVPKKTTKAKRATSKKKKAVTSRRSTRASTKRKAKGDTRKGGAKKAKPTKERRKESPSVAQIEDDQQDQEMVYVEEAEESKQMVPEPEEEEEPEFFDIGEEDDEQEDPEKEPEHHDEELETKAAEEELLVINEVEDEQVGETVVAGENSPEPEKQKHPGAVPERPEESEENMDDPETLEEPEILEVSQGGEPEGEEELGQESNDDAFDENDAVEPADGEIADADAEPQASTDDQEMQHDTEQPPEEDTTEMDTEHTETVTAEVPVEAEDLPGEAEEVDMDSHPGEEENQGISEEPPVEEDKEQEEDEDIEQEEEEEESHYRDKVGFKDGVSMLEHLKLQSQKPVRKVVVAKPATKKKSTESVSKVEKKAEKDQADEQVEETETEKGGARSYRVVIGLKRGARFQRRSDNLLSREDLNKARVVILEFALTAKNNTPRRVFTNLMKGPLKDVAHGAMWQDKGPLSFKHTVTKVLSEMQVARAKEKRLASAEAMFEENQELKKQCNSYHTEVKGLRDEVDRLKKRIKKATSCLMES